jgi:hypothetical protein
MDKGIHSMRVETYLGSKSINSFGKISEIEKKM